MIILAARGESLQIKCCLVVVSGMGKCMLVLSPLFPVSPLPLFLSPYAKVLVLHL